MKLKTDNLTTIFGFAGELIVLLIALGVIPLKYETALAAFTTKVSQAYLTNKKDISVFVDTEKDKLIEQVKAQGEELRKLKELL